jgi:hypothetical protein
MFRQLRPVALVIAIAITGAAFVALMPDPLMGPKRYGNRAGNPSCETDVKTAQSIDWRQVMDVSEDWPGLKKGVHVHAARHGSAWKLRIRPPRGPETKYVTDDIGAAFNVSCKRRLYVLRKELKVYSESLDDRKGAVRFGPAEPLVVTQRFGDGVTVEHPGHVPFAVRLDELKEAGTPIG